jgi:hypothetical protein
MCAGHKKEKEIDNLDSQLIKKQLGLEGDLKNKTIEIINL